ncbi:MAG: LysM peptidoglycan-binding domain-containing protein [Bacilli bacterium]|nr:LysM peptidoglycan-binding domain-containing protein [Bacilli bacterium]
MLENFEEAVSECTNTLYDKGTGATYTVKSGDTLYSIARIYNTTVDDIKQKNNLKSNTLSIGQTLII